MKSIILFFTFYFFLFPFLWAQDTWIQTYSPFYIDDGWYDVEDVIVCQDDGYAVNGTYVEYDSEMGIEWEHWGFLMKTDSNGNLLWVDADTVSFMSENESLAFIETDDGGYLSAGSSPWSSYLLKRDSEGNRLWSIFNDFHVESMCRTDDGNIILGGVTTDNGYPGIRKITQEAEILWTQDFFLSGSGIGRVNSIIHTSDEGFAATGYTSGNGFDLFILKTDTDGDSLWCETFDGFGDWDEGYCIIENSENDIFVSGYLRGNNRIYYGVMIKFDSDGELIFLLDEYSSDNFYCFFSMVDVITDNKIVGYGRDADGRALNFYNYDGESLWDTPLPLRVNGIGDKSLQMIDNGFILCGKSWGWDIALVKTDINGQVTSIDDEIISLKDYKLSNYPNPFNPQTTIKFNIPYSSNTLLQIYNVKGQLVNTLLNEKKQSGEYYVVWDARYQSSGIYFIKLSNGKSLIKTRKILLIK